MKSRRGLSAVIGTVFLVAIVIGALSYVGYSLEIMGTFSEQLMVEESRQKNIQNENYEIVSVEVTPGNKLGAVIKNTGQLPLKLTTLYIDENGIDDAVRKITIDKTIAPGKKIDLISENIDIDIDPDKGYNLKLVSSRGNTQDFSVNSGSSEPLYMTLHAFPSSVSTGFPSSLIFNVVNNMSNNNVLYNLTPVLQVDSETGLGTVDNAVGPFPTSYPSLKPGDVATFEYIYTVSGLEGQFVNFGVSLQNGYELPNNPGYLQSLNSTVVVKDVEIAITSGSSITSFGLQTSDNIDADVLFFHTGTFGISSGWPSGTTQMSGAENFGGGTDENTKNGPIRYVSSNMTATMALDAGNYNVTMQFYSDPVPPDLPWPSLAFFFECKDCPDTDMTTDFIGELDYIKDEHKGYLKEKETNPVWNAFGGPDNDGYFTFSQQKSFLKGEWKEDDASNTFNNIGNVPDTDSMWVRIPSTTLDYMPLLFMGEKGNTKDAYEISIGDKDTSTDDGRIVFRFEEDGGTETRCITNSGGPSGNGRYDNNQWQLITVIRTGGSTTHDTDCEIWVNGTDSGATVSPDGSDFNLDGVKDTAIGSTDLPGGMDSSTQQLNADVAMWMHWNDDELTSSQIEDLYYTNYGENATRINVTISLYDDKYTTLKQTIVDTNNVILPFFDVSEDSLDAISGSWTLNPLFSNSNPLAKWKYHQYNITGTSVSSYVPIEGDRLLLEIEIDADKQNLPINLFIDDTDFGGSTLAEMNSFLQTPPVTPSWPTFNTVTSEEETILTIFNEGPDGMWFVFAGTRFLVSTSDGITSYGAMPTATNAIEYKSNFYDLTEDTDGPYVANQDSVTITFNKLCNPASTDTSQLNNCANIPAGDYLGFVYLSGYDESGGNFIRTIELGNVHVLPAP